MNDLQQSIELQDSSTDSRLPSSSQMGRRAAIYFLAVLIVSVMIVWFGFLGWGLVAILQSVLEGVKNLWTHF
jgi:hypothetical protein